MYIKERSILVNYVKYICSFHICLYIFLLIVFFLEYMWSYQSSRNFFVKVVRLSMCNFGRCINLRVWSNSFCIIINELARNYHQWNAHFLHLDYFLLSLTFLGFSKRILFTFSLQGIVNAKLLFTVCAAYKLPLGNQAIRYAYKLTYGEFRFIIFST